MRLAYTIHNAVVYYVAVSEPGKPVEDEWYVADRWGQVHPCDDQGHAQQVAKRLEAEVEVAPDADHAVPDPAEHPVEPDA